MTVASSVTETITKSTFFVLRIRILSSIITIKNIKHVKFKVKRRVVFAKKKINCELFITKLFIFS